MLCNQISNFKDYYTTVACQSSIYIFQYAYNCILNRSRGLYQGNTVSGLGKNRNRPKCTHAVVFNTVGICRQPYYCSSERYGRLQNNICSHAPLMKLFILMQQTGFVNVNGNHYPIERFLSSDMKVGFVWFMEQPHVCVRTFSLYF